MSLIRGRKWNGIVAKLVAGMSAGLVTAAGGGCVQVPTGSGVRDVPATKASGARAADFLCASDVLPEAFVVYALGKGVNRDVASELFWEAMRFKSPKDPLTGFDGASDRLANLSHAMASVGKGAFGLYVEADLHNLGGLNSTLGNSAADDVFRFMATKVEEELRALAARSGATLCPTRHGGDEFSFVLVSQTSIGEPEGIAAMERARGAISDFARSFDVWAKLRDGTEGEPPPDTPPCLSKLPHPKHKNNAAYEGTGIYFAAKSIPARAGILEGPDLERTLKAEVFNVIDSRINAAKKAGFKGSGDCTFASTRKPAGG